MYTQEVINGAYQRILAKVMEGKIEITTESLNRGYRAYSRKLNGPSSVPFDGAEKLNMVFLILFLFICAFMALMTEIYLLLILWAPAPFVLGYQVTKDRDQFEILLRKELSS